jgi:hypothetical protein
MHSFISLLRFEFSERKNAHPYFLRDDDITTIFAIFRLTDRFGLSLPNRKASNMPKKYRMRVRACWSSRLYGKYVICDDFDSSLDFVEIFAFDQ